MHYQKQGMEIGVNLTAAVNLMKVKPKSTNFRLEDNVLRMEYYDMTNRINTDARI